MKIYEAAVVVLREENRPMSSNDIYNGIKSRRLFEFSAKDPVAVVSKALRSRSHIVSTENITILFEKSDDGSYSLISYFILKEVIYISLPCFAF